MKKNYIDYYAFILLILFIVYNLFLRNIKIFGLLYQIFMYLLLIVNTIILIAYRRSIKYKELIIVVYLLIWLFSKNILQCFFAFSNIIVLCIIGFREKKSIKIISFLILILGYILFIPLYFIFLLVFGTKLNNETGINDIYENTHYYCNNNYEVYSYSAGAMDSYHYNLGKYYKILDIKDIINISYNERNEITYDEYKIYLNTHKCKLAGD